jgi:pimeloyl-ACP methyl ester carboxylesterase
LKFSNLKKLSRRQKYIRTGILTLICLWTLIPIPRTLLLMVHVLGRGTPSSQSLGVTPEEVSFLTPDNVKIAGWFIEVSSDAPTIILVHGFKNDRPAMIPWARFLKDASYNVLMYDSRGCGRSDGWYITLGVHETDDLSAAVHYLADRKDLTNHHMGALGVSLGAGTVILGAAREPLLEAVVADSAWSDLQPQIDRMNSLSLGPVALPLLPYARGLAEWMIKGDLSSVRPIDEIAKIAPRSVFLIYSADDKNTLTAPSGNAKMYAAAHMPKQQWVVPSGGHVGGLFMHTDEYKQRVLTFFQENLK